MKQKIIAAAVAAIVGTAAADANHSFYRTGFYAGGHVGGTYGWGKFNSTLNTGAVANNLQLSSGKARNFAMLFGVSSGYQHLMANGLTLGGDVKFDLYSNNSLTTNTIHSPASITMRNQIKRNWGITPSFNVGKVFAERYHAYLGLGFDYSHMRYDVFSYDENQAQKKTLHRFAFVPSLGMDYALSHNIALTGNISYELFSTAKMSADNTIYPGSPASSGYSSKIKPHFVTARLGVKYKF